MIFFEHTTYTDGYDAELVAEISAFAILVLVLYFADKIHKNTIKNYAKRNGMTYVDSSQRVACTEYFKIFECGSVYNPVFNDLVYGNENGVSFQIAEYTYVTGYGDNKDTHFYAICLLRKEGVRMPHFLLRKEKDLFDLFGGSNITAVKDIFLLEDAVFAKKFCLSCPSFEKQSSVISFFDRRVRSVFIAKSKEQYVYEGSNDFFLAYKSGLLDNAERLKLYNNALSIFNAISVKKVKSFTGVTKNSYSGECKNNNMP